MADPRPRDPAGGALAAGRTALAQGEWAAARDAYERSVAAEVSPEALEGLGAACRWLGQSRPMFRSWGAAYRLYRQGDDRLGAARVARQVAFGELYFHGDVPVARGWLERADRLLAGLERGVEHGWQAAYRAHLALQVDADTVAARRQAAEALAVARVLGLGDLEVMALAQEGVAMVSDGEVDEGMRRLDEAAAAAMGGEVDDPDAVSSACCYLIDACKRTRDYGRAARWCERVSEFSERWSDRITFAACRTHYADILMWRGSWAEAERELQTNLGPLAEINSGRVADALVRLAELRRRQGRGPEAERLAAAAEGHPLVPLVRGGLALDRGDPVGAAQEAERALRRMPRAGRTDRAVGLELLVRARVTAGDVPGARDAAGELRDIAGRAGTDAAEASARQAEGLACGAGGSWEAARRAHEDAVDLFARAGGRFEAAQARRDLAQALRALGQDEAAAREARAADDALRRMGARAGIAPEASPAGLTPRELEVLRLVAQGRSNQQIAAALVLSVRTVERHVANIYDKIGASGRAGRAAAASYALAVGLR